MSILAKIISTLTGLEIWLFPKSDSPMEYIASNLDLRKIRKELDISSLKSLPHENDDPALIYRDAYGFSYIHGIFSDFTMACGPFYEKERPVQDLEIKGLAMELLLPVLSMEEVHAIGQMMRLAANQRGPEVLRRIPFMESDAMHNPAYEDLHRMNQETIDRSYEMERTIRNLVATGNRTGMKEFLRGFTPTETMIRRIPSEPLRQAKNGSVILNTILRLSAEKGGLIPIHLHGMSWEFAGRIERAKSVDDLSTLRGEMCLAYCDAVHKFSLSNHSLLVRKTAEYVLTHLDQKLSLGGLSDRVSCSAPYLARQFKKEYGMSVGEFIREKKIEEARYLLTNTGDGLAEISMKLGFEDMGYFTRVFKKIVGIPPSTYRDKMAAGVDVSIPS